MFLELYVDLTALCFTSTKGLLKFEAYRRVFQNVARHLNYRERNLLVLPRLFGLLSVVKISPEDHDQVSHEME